jgi:hypothetical protein
LGHDVALHVHELPTQLVPLTHSLPQVPQLELSVCLFVHAPLHRSGFAPEHTQAPAVEVQFPSVQVPHTAPRVPHCVGPSSL